MEKEYFYNVQRKTYKLFSSLGLHTSGIVHFYIWFHFANRTGCVTVAMP